MDLWSFGGLVVLAFVLALAAFGFVRRVTVYETQHGVRFVRGKQGLLRLALRLIALIQSFGHRLLRGPKDQQGFARKDNNCYDKSDGTNVGDGPQTAAGFRFDRESTDPSRPVPLGHPPRRRRVEL